MPEPAGVSIQVPGLACSVCGVLDLVAIAPGDAEDRPLELFIIDRGEPMRAWCWEHWPVREAPAVTGDMFGGEA